MCSHFPAASALAFALLIAGCHRENRDVGRFEEKTAVVSTMPALQPGGEGPVAGDARGTIYESNSFALSEGQRLYTQFNCVGCHAHGGGDIGPALMDDQWRYGGRIEQIVATIDEGRPNGMPSFRRTLTRAQMWQIAAYVRSMSGNVPKDVVSSRGDELANTPPLTRVPTQPPSGGSDVAPQGLTP